MALGESTSASVIPRPVVPIVGRTVDAELLLADVGAPELTVPGTSESGAGEAEVPSSRVFGLVFDETPIGAVKLGPPEGSAGHVGRYMSDRHGCMPRQENR